MARRRNLRRYSDDQIVTALIYTRVSKGDQAREGLSLPAQLQACRQYAAQRGWLIGHEYSDVLSGKRDDRVNYQRLLTDAERLAGEGKRVAVIVLRLDRLGRRLIERVQTREAFKKIGVATHSVKEGEVNDMVATFLAAMAEQEVEQLGERVRDVRDFNVANGWSTPGRPAWGLRLRPATDDERKQGAPKSVLVPDEVTLPHVREAFRLVASGEMTPRALASWVAALPHEAKGLVPRTVEDDDGVTRVELVPRKLHPSMVRRLLSAAVYVGRFEPDDANHPGERGRWEAIIDQQTFDKVQARLAATKGRTGPVSGAHLLTGMLRCPECGSKVSGWTIKVGSKRYRCSGFNKGGEDAVRACKGSAIAQPIDDAVTAEVRALLAPVATTNAAARAKLARAWDRLRKPDDAAAKERARRLAKAKADVTDAKRRIADAARLLVDGVLDRTAYAALADVEQARLESAERTLQSPEIAATATDLPALDDVLDTLGGWQAILERGPIPQRRDLFKTLIRSVTPVRGERRGQYTVNVVWTEEAQALRSITA